MKAVALWIKAPLAAEYSIYKSLLVLGQCYRCFPRNTRVQDVQEVRLTRLKVLQGPVFLWQGAMSQCSNSNHRCPMFVVYCRPVNMGCGFKPNYPWSTSFCFKPTHLTLVHVMAQVREHPLQLECWGFDSVAGGWMEHHSFRCNSADLYTAALNGQKETHARCGWQLWCRRAGRSGAKVVVSLIADGRMPRPMPHA